MKTQTEIEQESAGKNEFDDVALNPHFENARQTYGSNDKQAGPMLLEDDLFIKKWSGPLILGPALPAFLALLNITYGQILVVTWKGSCGYALDGFVAASVAVCYIFLLCYFWVFLGKELYITLPLAGRMKVASPYTSLKTLMGVYFAILVLSVIVWMVGTILVQSAAFCEKGAPELYRYCMYLMVMYWMVFSVLVAYGLKLLFGSTLEKVIREKTREPTIADAAENIFRSKYKKYDPDMKEKQIERKAVKSLLKDLGVFIPPEEMESLVETFDQEETGFVPYEAILEWFTKMNEEIDDSDLDSDDSNAAEDKEVAAIEAKEKQKRREAKANKASTAPKSKAK